MEPLELKTVIENCKFEDYKNTPVRKLPFMAVKKNYSSKIFYNMRIDLLALLSGDSKSLSYFSHNKNILSEQMINENDHHVVSSTVTFFPKHEEYIEYKKEKEPLFINEFLMEMHGNSGQSFFFSILKNDPDFIYQMPPQYSKLIFSFLFSHDHHIDDTFRPQELYADVNNLSRTSHDKQITKMAINAEDIENRTYTKSQILLNYFTYIKDNNITPSKNDKKYFDKYLKTLVGNYNYPSTLSSLFSYFNSNNDFYSSKEVFSHFTLHFCKPYWDAYNKHHRIQPNKDITFHNFSCFSLFFQDEDFEKNQSLSVKSLNFLSTISYNHSFFMKKNKELLSDIYKKLQKSIYNKKGNNIVQKTIKEYYDQRTILLRHNKTDTAIIEAFIELFYSMNFKLNFNNYSDYVVRKVIDDNDFSILKRKPFLHLCEKTDLKNHYLFNSIRMFSISSLLCIDNKIIFQQILDDINKQAKQDYGQNRSNSLLFNYLFHFYLDNFHETDELKKSSIEDSLICILQAITEKDDNLLLMSIKRDKSKEKIDFIDIQLEKLKIKANLSEQKIEQKILSQKNKRL